MATGIQRVSIREAAATDVEEIAALHLASWRAAYSPIVPDGFLESVTLESRITRWRAALSASESPHTKTIVAVGGGTILGVCSFGPRRPPDSSLSGEIYALHIRPDRWRVGLGKRLLDDSVRRLAARGFTGAVLWVLRQNQNARRFYEAQGWTVTGEELVEDRSGYAIPETRYAITFLKGRSRCQGVGVL